MLQRHGKLLNHCCFLFRPATDRSVIECRTPKNHGENDYDFSPKHKAIGVISDDDDDDIIIITKPLRS